MRKNQQNRGIVLLIGNNIAELRKAKKMTQEDFAKVLNLSRPSIINIESGKHCCTFETLITICTLFDCEIWDLVPPIKEGKLHSAVKQLEKEKRAKILAKRKTKIEALEKQLKALKGS